MIKQTQCIKNKRVVINGYDEMKENKYRIKKQMQNETLPINTNQQVYKYEACDTKTNMV